MNLLFVPTFYNPRELLHLIKPGTSRQQMFRIHHFVHVLSLKNTKNKIMCIVCQFSLSSTLNLSWKLKWWDFTYNFQCAIFKNLFCKGLRHYIWIIGSEKAAAAKLWFFFCQSLLYLFFLLQVVHVGQRQHGRPPVSTLERQLAPGQSFDEAVALLQAQAIIKLNGP